MANYPLTEKYLGKIIEKRQNLNNPQNSPLLQIITNNKTDGLEKLLVNTENKIGNFTQIFQITNELNDKDSDERINDMIAELRGGAFLINEGFINIKYQKNRYDFYCKKDNKEYAIEITFIRGPDFKKQKKTALGDYDLNIELVLLRLKSKIEKEFSQLPKYFQRIVIVVTNNLELDKFFDEEIEKFRKQMEQSYKSKIHIITNGYIYG